MHDWLGMVPEETKAIFLELTAATCTKSTWIRGSHVFHPSISFMNGTWRHCLQSFSTLGWCSTWIMGETKCCWWAQQQLIGISISLDFHHYVNNVIVLVRPKDVLVYARGSTTSKTTFRISLVLTWFDDSPHSNQGLDKTIDSTADHRDQSMKISSFFNTHTHSRISLSNELSQASFYLPTLQVVV